MTNNTLASRAGTELYVRDVSLALRRRGHEVVAWSRTLGDVAEELHREGLLVVDRLDAVPWRPELIHGQHHLETLAALTWFAGVPGIYICHGWSPWQERPFLHPRLVAYAAVDEATLEFCVGCGVPRERIRLLLNFADLRRFRPRGPLPERPRRALIFSNYAHEGSHLPAVREACRAAGLELDVVGSGVGRPAAHPEEVLGQYDLIFAKGRGAIEALVTGAAVITCDELGVGSLVTTDNLPWMRAFNFGSKTFRSPPRREVLEEEIRRYNAAGAQEVARRMRIEADMEKAIDRLLLFYEEALAEFPRRRIEPGEEARATVAYLAYLSALLKGGTIPLPAAAPLVPPPPPSRIRRILRYVARFRHARRR